MEAASGVSVDDNGLDIGKIPLADNGNSKGKTLNNANVSGVTPSRVFGVATLEPYLPTSGPSGVPIRQSIYIRNVNSNKNDFGRIAVLPGVFECNSYEKYLTIELDSDKKIYELDIFDVHKEIVKCCGREPKIALQNDGSLLIETSSPEESKKLLTLKSVSGLKAKCSPHPSFNQVQGVIHSQDLLKYSEERIQKKLENQKVVNVHRMHKKVDGILVPLPTLILTFDMVKLPSTVKAAWLRLRVKPHVPTPKHCYHCQRFGHVLAKCRSKRKNLPGTCFNCGQTIHGECNKTPFCVNCGEGHPSSSRKYDNFILEQEIQAIRVKDHISFSEVKQKVLAQCIRPGISFATDVSKSKKQVQDRKQSPNHAVSQNFMNKSTLAVSNNNNTNNKLREENKK